MANFDGRGSEHRLEKKKTCPNCKKAGKVYYTGSEVMHGNPFSPAADTEIDHHYECENCDHHWRE